MGYLDGQRSSATAYMESLRLQREAAEKQTENPTVEEPAAQRAPPSGTATAQQAAQPHSPSQNAEILAISAETIDDIRTSLRGAQRGGHTKEDSTLLQGVGSHEQAEPPVSLRGGISEDTMTDIRGSLLGVQLEGRVQEGEISSGTVTNLRSSLLGIQTTARHEESIIHNEGSALGTVAQTDPSASLSKSVLTPRRLQESIAETANVLTRINQTLGSTEAYPAAPANGQAHSARQLLAEASGSSHTAAAEVTTGSQDGNGDLSVGGSLLSTNAQPVRQCDSVVDEVHERLDMLDRTAASSGAGTQQAAVGGNVSDGVAQKLLSNHIRANRLRQAQRRWSCEPSMSPSRGSPEHSVQTPSPTRAAPSSSPVAAALTNPAAFLASPARLPHIVKGPSHGPSNSPARTRSERLASLTERLTRDGPSKTSTASETSSTMDRLAQLEGRLGGLGVISSADRAPRAAAASMEAAGEPPVLVKHLSDAPVGISQAAPAPPQGASCPKWRKERIADMSEKVRAERMSTQGHAGAFLSAHSPIRDAPPVGVSSPLTRGSPTRYSGPPDKASLQRSPPLRSRTQQPMTAGVVSPIQHLGLSSPQQVTSPAQPFRSPLRSPLRSPESRKLAHLVSPQQDRPVQQDRPISVSGSPTARSPVVPSNIRSPNLYRSPDRQSRLAQMEEQVRMCSVGLAKQVNTAAYAISSPEAAKSPGGYAKSPEAATLLLSPGEDNLRRAVLFEETAQLLCSCSSQLLRALPRAGSALGLSSLLTILTNQMSLGPCNVMGDVWVSVHFECLFPGLPEDTLLSHVAWIGLFSKISGPSESLEQINDVYSTYKERLTNLLLLPSSPGTDGESELHEEVGKALQTWLSPAHENAQLCTNERPSPAPGLPPPILRVDDSVAPLLPITPRDIPPLPLAPSSAATSVAAAVVVGSARADTSKGEANECENRDEEKLQQLRIELTQARARVVRLVSDRSSAALYQQSAMLLHEWRVRHCNTKNKKNCAREKRWRDQAEKLFGDIAESNEKLVSAQKERDEALAQLNQADQVHDDVGGHFWQQMSAEDREAALAVMSAQDKAAVLAAMTQMPRKEIPRKLDSQSTEAERAMRRLDLNFNSRACQQQMRQLIGVMQKRCKTAKAQWIALSRAASVCTKQFSRNEGLLWAMARWMPAPALARMAQELEEQQLQTAQLRREVSERTDQFQEASNDMQGARDSQVDQMGAEAKCVELIQEGQQLREQLSNVQMKSEAQGMLLSNAQAQLEAALNRQHELGEQLRESEQSEQQYREEAVIAKQALSAQITKLTKEKTKHLAELKPVRVILRLTGPLALNEVVQAASAEVAKFSSRWNFSFTSFTNRCLKRRRNQILYTMLQMLHKTRQLKQLAAAAGARSQNNLVRLFGWWVQSGVARHHLDAQLQQQAEATLFQQRSAALLGEQRKRTNLMRAMGRWQQCTLQTQLCLPPQHRSIARFQSPPPSPAAEAQSIELAHARKLLEQKENMSPVQRYIESGNPLYDSSSSPSRVQTSPIQTPPPAAVSRMRFSSRSPDLRSPFSLNSQRMNQQSVYILTKQDLANWSPSKRDLSIWAAGASIVCRVVQSERHTSLMRIFTEWMAFTSLSQIQKMRKMGKKTMRKVGEHKALRKLHELTASQMSQLKQASEAEVQHKEELVQEKEEENKELLEKLRAAEEVGKMQRKAKEALKKRVASLERGIKASRQPLEVSNVIE